MIDLANWSQNTCRQPMQLPINSSKVEQLTRIVDILKHQRTQLMICIEFDINSPPQEETPFFDKQQEQLRELTQAYVDSSVHFSINATCHG